MVDKWWDVDGHGKVLLNLIKEEKPEKIAEIGIFEARLARFLLRNTGDIIKEYWGVDKYSQTWENVETYKFPRDNEKTWFERYKRACRYMPFFTQFRLLKMNSYDASQLFPKKYFPNGYFDFVYIDGDHSYEMVKKDILAWLPLVKENGIIGGHDYNFPEEAVPFNGVRKAVDEVIGRFNIIRFKKEGVWIHYPNKEKYHESYDTRLSLYKEDPTKLYTKEFVRLKTKFQKKVGLRLGESLPKILGDKTFVDFGCCIGSYLEGALAGGASSVLGFDIVVDKAQEYISDHMRPYIRCENIGRRIECGEWDCVISIEVAEHLIPEEAEIFVDNIARSCRNHVIFTASNVKGYYHFNPKPKDYWIKMFEDRGFKYSNELTNRIKEEWEVLGAENFVLINLMVFKKNEIST